MVNLMPRVSIGLPVYNGAAYLEQSIRSVLDQTYTDLELIISDNASTDGTVAIIERLAAKDARIVFLQNDENRGAAWNYNAVFTAATGEFFRWHAHDDWFEPGLIAALVVALDSNPDAVLAHSWTRFVDDDGAFIREFHDDLGATDARPRRRLAEIVRRLTFCNAVFGLIRRTTLADTALIASFPGSDVSLLYELAVRGQFKVVPELLYVRRPGNSIKSNLSTQAVAEWFDPRGRGKRRPGAHLWWATMQAIWRSPYPVDERVATTVAFHRAWPLDYVRKTRRRRARRRRASDLAAS